MDRARAANRRVALDSRTTAAVVQICRRLDGMPLALELAAAWAAVLPVPVIAERLASGLGLPVASTSQATRHSTVENTVEWSLALLSDAERRVFENVSVFQGGSSLVAAEAVAGPDVLSSLAHLVTASLVLCEPGLAESPRYRVLEPLREVAAARLAASDRPELVFERHAGYFLDLSASVQHGLWGREAPGGGIALLEQDSDNLRAALRWLIKHADHERAGRLGAGLARFWQFSGRVVEGRAWLEELLALEGISSGVRARLLVALAAALTYQQDLVAASSLLDPALTAAREAADDWAIACCVRAIFRPREP